MCDTATAKQVGLIAVGAIAAFGFGFLSFWLQRRFTARDAFHAVIDGQIAKLDAIDQANRRSQSLFIGSAEDLFIEDSTAVLIAAVRQVKRHATDEERHSLTKALADYIDYQTQYKGMGRMRADTVAGRPNFSETVHSKLTKIDECITNIPVA